MEEWQNGGHMFVGVACLLCVLQGSPVSGCGFPHIRVCQLPSALGAIAKLS
jgi:hypothetical protein